MPTLSADEMTRPSFPRPAASITHVNYYEPSPEEWAQQEKDNPGCHEPGLPGTMDGGDCAATSIIP